MTSSRRSVRYLQLWIMLAATAVSVFWAATLHASTPYFVATGGADTSDCLTLATACQHIAAALEKASAGDIVIIADGTYTENITLDKDITLIGFGQDVTIINGGGIERVMTVTTGTSADVSNLTFTNGASHEPLWTGGIYVSGTLRLAHSTLIATNGAAIRNGGFFDGNRLHISENNKGVWNTGSATIDNSTIQKNLIGVLNYGAMRLSNGLVLSNTSSPFPGAGISNFGTFAIDGSLIRANRVDYAHGGGVYNEGTLLVTNTLIVSNTAFTAIFPSANTPDSINAFGGGIYNSSYPRGIVTLTHSAVYGNYATSGGDQISNNGTALLVNVTVSGGTGPRGMQSGAMTLTNVTISDMPNGVGASSIVVARNTIVNAPCYGTMTSLGHNLDSGNSCGFTATGDITNSNPLLGLLQYNGGATPTHALLPGSPAINAGDNANCPATDQRGVPRPQLGACDIGAFEFANPSYLPFLYR